MDAKLLGCRIKEARLAKKMTQSEVVGDFITRNMLSQIESGNAVPSMKTLDYLAGVLSLSASELLRGENVDASEAASTEELLQDIHKERESEEYLKARSYVEQKQFSEALKELSSMAEGSSFSAEAHFLIAYSALYLAKEKKEGGELDAALEYAKLAEQHAGTGMFSSPSMKNEALKLLAFVAGALAE